MMQSTCATQSWRVAVLAGGDSAEREISLRSGAAVARALGEAGHRPLAIDPAGRDLADIDWTAFDACFIALHGGAGEDGRVQQELERLGVGYTGSGPAACRLAMSKRASKERFVERRVPTLPWALVDAHGSIDRACAKVAPLGYPLVVKPDAQGSSLGVTIVEGPDSLAGAMHAAGQFGIRAIAEPRVVGREFTIAVLDERALPIIEIITPERVFSFEAKYASSLTEYRFDFELDTRKRVELLHAAVAATKALGTRGLSRVDLMVGHDGRVWVLEVNAIPGMSQRSLAPLAAQRAGLPMAVLCEELVRPCLEVASVA
jgi:D-alanine-D-alanine ligase